MFLEILQNLQDSICTRVSFLIKLQALGNVSKYLKTLKKNPFLKLELLKLVRPLITKKIKKLERAVSAVLKCSVTLRYLTVDKMFDVPVQGMQFNNCTIYSELKDTYLKVPSAETEWESNSIKKQQSVGSTQTA